MPEICVPPFIHRAPCLEPCAFGSGTAGRGRLPKRRAGRFPLDCFFDTIELFQLPDIFFFFFFFRGGPPRGGGAELAIPRS